MNKCNRIIKYYVNQITSSKLVSGQKLPTEHQIAEKFSCSRPTVVRAMRELQTSGIITRKQGSGSYVNISSSKKNLLLGIIASGIFSRNDLNNSIFISIIGMISSILSQRGSALIFSGIINAQDHKTQIKQAEEMIGQYIHQGASGIFYVPLLLPDKYAHINLKLVNKIIDAGIPVVLLDRDLGEIRSSFDLVSMDHFQAGYQLTQELINMGAKRVDFISSKISANSIIEREEGWLKAKKNFKIEGQSLHIEEFDEHALIKYAKASTADAVIGYNDDTAIFAKRIFAQQNKKDIVFGGFDNRFVGESEKIITVAHPEKEIAQAAVDVMFSRIANPTAPAQTRQFAPQVCTQRTTQFVLRS